jgi:alcohol dehydrogenase
MMTKTFWQTPAAGAIKNLRLKTEELLPLKSDQIRIKTKAIGLNFADVFALAGLYSAAPKGAFTPGLEFAGVVMEIGEQVQNFKVGDSVMGGTRFGGYSSVIDIEPHYCLPLPEGWTFAEGAAYLVQTLTAYYALKSLGAVQAEQNVLIHSAAGGVGLQAMKICQKLNANPIGTVGNQEKKAFLNQLGFEQVIVRSGNLPQAVQQILAGNDLHLVLDAIGGKIQRQSYELLAPMGRMVVFGAAQFTPGKNRPNYLKSLWKYITKPSYDAMKMIKENKSVLGFNLILLWDQIEMFRALVTEFNELGLEPPHVGRSFAFEEAPAAIEYLRSGQSIGKVVLAF